MKNFYASICLNFPPNSKWVHLFVHTIRVSCNGNLPTLWANVIEQNNTAAYENKKDGFWYNLFRLAWIYINHSWFAGESNTCYIEYIVPYLTIDFPVSSYFAFTIYNQVGSFFPNCQPAISTPRWVLDLCFYISPNFPRFQRPVSPQSETVLFHLTLVDCLFVVPYFSSNCFLALAVEGVSISSSSPSTLTSDKHFLGG